MVKMPILLLFWCLCTQVMANETDFAVSKISPALLINANAVIRTEEQSFEVVNRGKALYQHRYVITVLNPSGDAHAVFFEYYDQHRKIQSAEGFLYDEAGKLLRKMKLKDAEDVSGVDEGSLITDIRIKRHSFFLQGLSLHR